MRFVVGLFWTFLLTCMATYIVGAMGGHAGLDLTKSSIMSVVIFAMVVVLGEIMPMNKEKSQH
ncbi:YjzD family protein [Bacillus changyiensis]|uniref:YjzD family protein n=1 Tax=Bacillus changyiensis TaxID=3004103 RepID=UPI0022E77764|nr:YjzD family protein [Bacillus changyiensis]MDA1475935.1 YjzD family protein [Bacillus changyiensis]